LIVGRKESYDATSISLRKDKKDISPSKKAKGLDISVSR